MAIYFNTNIFLLAFFTVTVILSSSNNVVGQGCQSDVQGLISQCASYVKKEGPKINHLHNAAMLSRKQTFHVCASD